VKPYLTKIFRKVQCPTILNICGSAKLIVANMISCGSDAIAVGERTPIQEAREIAEKLKQDYPIIGNVSSYEVLHKGPINRIQEEVTKTVAAGVSMVAPGCDFWLETPTEHIKAFVDVVHQQDLRET
jgi:uroporphyrinogen-III decarboxylase